MPETRYIKNYDIDGNLVSTIPYEVSDQQLMIEQLEKDCNEAHDKVILAIKNWGVLTLAQKDELLKFLAKFYILAGARLGFFSF